jgi:hypothetical protein
MKKPARSKTLRLTGRQVGYIRCFLYPRLRTGGDEERKELSVILRKLERLWKEPLYTGTGEKYIPPHY